MVGFAFNNRLLLGGFAGNPQATPGSLNPNKDPAQENLTLLLIDAHRMLNLPIRISNARPVQGCPQPVARNRPYVASKLRGRVACLGYFGRQ
jgi:hypothetical protein